MAFFHRPSFVNKNYDRFVERFREFGTFEIGHHRRQSTQRCSKTKVTVPGKIFLQHSK